MHNCMFSFTQVLFQGKRAIGVLFEYEGQVGEWRTSILFYIPIKGKVKSAKPLS